MIVEGLELVRDEAAKTESYYCTTPCAVIDAHTIQLLKARLPEQGGTVRICLHHDRESILQEMIVVHRKGGSFEPHKHPEKDESYHLIDGRMRVDLYDPNGRVQQSLIIGGPGSGLPFLVRVARDTWHATVPDTEFVVFHESRPGPFTRGDSVFADWK